MHSPAALALVLLAAPIARAQMSGKPSIVFAVSGGFSGASNLWSVERQPLRAPGGAFDTVRLGRRVESSLTATVAMTYYPSAHWGLNAEVGYFGTRSQQQCAGPAAYVSDPDFLNQQACENGNGRHVASSVVGFLAGGAWRPVSTGWIQPYLRANAGFAFPGASFVETMAWVSHPTCQGSTQTCPYTVLVDDHKPSIMLMASIAGGVSLAFLPGYRLRGEVRDLVMDAPRVERAAAPGPTGNVAEVTRGFRHVPIFMVGLDIMIEQQRTRRY